MKLRRIVYLLLALALTGLVVFTSLNTGDTYSGIGGWLGPWVNRVFFFGRLSEVEVATLVGFGSKFIGHFWLFAFTGLFWWLFLTTFKKKKIARLALLVGLALASLGECLQVFTAGRFPSFEDVVLNYCAFLFLPLCRSLFLVFQGREFASEDIVKEHAEK